jgi:hypothetical protein
MPTVDISAGTLPPPTCYASEQDRLDAYAAALIANINTGAEWSTSQVVPGNTGLYWLRTDISNRPVEVMKFSAVAGDSAFIRLSSEVVFAGTSTGAAGAYSVINSPPYPSPGSAYRTGQIYTFLANHTNAAGCTLNVDGQGAKTITKDGTVALIANDILIGQVVSVLYDGVNFQLLTQKRDFTRLSLKQFLTYASAPIPIVQDGTFMPFNHGFGVMPFMVRAVLIRATGLPGTFDTYTDASTAPNTVFTWYEGQEVDCLHFLCDRTTDLPAFRYLCDPSQINVQATAFNAGVGGLIFSYMIPPLLAASNATNYRIKVYATALNPAYVP